jgi:cbb3-type cytochrome oxidase subunit 3
MKALVLSRTDLLFLPEIALFIFLAVFVGALAWMFRPGAKRFYQERSSMPLDPDEMEPENG